MAGIGLIVYNLQDFANSGGLISTSASDRSKTVCSVNEDGTANSSYTTLKIDVTLNIVLGNGYKKIGILAPAGTKVILNKQENEKTILIGRTGIYELDEDILITSIKFIKPKNYILNIEATDDALEKGLQNLDAAETWRETELAKHANTRDTTIADLLALYDAGEITLAEFDLGIDKAEEIYWTNYNDVLDKYFTEHYAPALALFNSGVNGIYKLDPVEPESDLFNIIIDFVL